MSEITNPISMAFEVQRNTIEQGQTAVEQTVDRQSGLNQAFLESVDSQVDLQQRGVEISRTAVHTYLDAVSSLSSSTMDSLWSPSTDVGAVDEIRATIDDQYDALLSSHEVGFEAVSAELENGVESYDDLLAENLNIYATQIEAVLESHEELEEQTIANAEELIEQVDELQSELEGQTEQVQQQFTEQIQEQFEQLQDQLTEHVEEQMTITERTVDNA